MQRDVLFYIKARIKTLDTSNLSGLSMLHTNASGIKCEIANPEDPRYLIKKFQESSGFCIPLDMTFTNFLFCNTA